MYNICNVEWHRCNAGAQRKYMRHGIMPKKGCSMQGSRDERLKGIATVTQAPGVSGVQDLALQI